jgi:hypothetical protein
MVQVVGFTGNPTTPLLSSAYNVIAVNRTDSAAIEGSPNGTGAYTAGRAKPDLVVPADSTSSAAPRIASASALLIQAGHASPSLSTDPAGTYKTIRSGGRVYNAERVEVIRAALLAGADRYTRNTTSADIKDYRVALANRTANGLDRRFGAGQLNISNSYHVIAAGEQNSSEDKPATGGLIASQGFDYDPAFGGLSSSNTTATYRIAQASGPMQLTAALVWDLSINGGTSTAFDSTATMYDLGLRLYDVTDPNNWILVASAESPSDNTENLWRRLDSGKSYAIRVVRGATQAAFKWDFGLAWNITPIAPLAVDAIVLPDAQGGMAYPATTLTASGGQGPYSWSVIAGTLPPGITVSTAGVISGTPTTLATYVFTVQVTDANGDTANRALGLRVTECSLCSGGCH